MIEIKSLYKKFGSNEVLKGIDIVFPSTGVFAVLGPNSSGKTTMIKSFLGMVVPDKGELIYKNQEVSKKWEYRKSIGYLPQIAKFPDNLKVKELIHMISDVKGKGIYTEELIKYFDLMAFLDDKLGKLSGGTRQKVNIVLAFMYDSDLLILDEPTSGLDPVSLIKLKELIIERKNKGKLILMTTHIMSIVEEMADELVFLLEGKIHYRGKPDEMMQKFGAPNLERAIANMMSGKPMISTNGNKKTEDDSKSDVMITKSKSHA
jgi:Cu-processing system ATP-binding protein